MGTSSAPTPTDSELSILQVLWRTGPSTVKVVHSEISDVRDTGYTTTLKLLQIMHKKRLVKRDDSGFAHVYRAAVQETHVQGSMLGDLVDRAFDGSVAGLTLRALALRKASPEELAEIRRIIDDLEDKAK